MRHAGSEDEPSIIHPHFLYPWGGERKVMGSSQEIEKILDEWKKWIPKYKQMILDMIEANDGLAQVLHAARTRMWGDLFYCSYSLGEPLPAQKMYIDELLQKVRNIYTSREEFENTVPLEYEGADLKNEVDYIS
jgi:hypothetical protein